MLYHLKPNPDRTVNGVPLKIMDPVRGDFLPENGRTVPKTPYWIRRLRKGEVIEFDPNFSEETAAEAPTEEPAEEAPAEEPAGEAPADEPVEEAPAEEPAEEAPADESVAEAPKAKTKRKAKTSAAPENGEKE